MQYVGGKHHLSKKIVEYMQPYFSSKQIYLEPFVGAVNVIIKVPDTIFRIGSDIDKDLITMWSALQYGWQPPEMITKEQYDYYRTHSVSDNFLKGYISYAASYRSKKWGGYTLDYKIGENYRGTLRKQKLLNNIAFFYADYRYWRHIENAVIFCDPPYYGTTDYKTKFDHELFWQTVWYWHLNNNVVFVTEYTMPDFMTILYEKEKTNSIGDNKFKKTEKLGVLEIY